MPLQLVAAALIALMFARMLDAATRLSPVVDEQSHISHGLAAARTGDMRLVMGHPLLASLWMVLPLLPDATVRLPLDDESWRYAAWDRFGERFLWQANRDVRNPTISASEPRPTASHEAGDQVDGRLPIAGADRIVFRSRVMVMLLTLALGALVFRWAAEWWGGPAGVLALVLYSFDPNVLANGMLATTDMGVTLFAFAATYQFWRISNRRDASRARDAALAGALIGLACASKFSALAFLPVWGILAIVTFGGSRSSTALRRALGYSVVFMASAFATVWLVYLGRMDAYWAELRFILHAAEEHPAFLLGQLSVHGWWYYFPTAFALKTPVPTLILLAVSLGGLVGRLRARPGGQVVKVVPFILLPAAWYFAVSMASGFNIGYRHLLPILPFLFVLCGYLATVLPGQRSHASNGTSVAWSVALCILISSLLISSFLSHPNYLAYFNALSPQPHYNVLVDSNLDWGQGLRQLAGFVRRQGWPSLKLSYFGPGDPAQYGVSYEPLPRWPPPPATVDYRPANPAPGRYAISATNLLGVLLADPNTFQWFRARTPEAVVAGSILVYEVPADPHPPAGAVLCRVPWTPVEDAVVGSQVFGRSDLRVVRIDCDASWLWFAGSATLPITAWAVVPPGAFPRATWAGGMLDYEHPADQDAGSYGVFRVTGGPAIQDPLPAPAKFDVGLTMLGFGWQGAVRAGERFEAWSYWRVDESSDTSSSPIPPISLFAHLRTADGATVAGADGLGVELRSLHTGDVFAQRHLFQVPPGTRIEELQGSQALRIHAGVYRLDTMARFHLRGNGSPDATEVVSGAVPAQ